MTAISLPAGTQKNTVLHHLRVSGAITHAEAETVYKIRRLAARVGELRAEGWNIISESRTDEAGQRYTRYKLGRPMKRRRG